MKHKERRKKRSKKKLLACKHCFLALVLFFLVIFYVWERVELLGAGYAIKEKAKRTEELSKEREVLLLEAVRLKSPQRLEKIAREELGLVVSLSKKAIRQFKQTAKVKE